MVRGVGEKHAESGVDSMEDHKEVLACGQMHQLQCLCPGLPPGTCPGEERWGRDWGGL